MYSKKFDEDLQVLRDKVVGLDVEAMAMGYALMGDLNTETANEMYHLETEATYSVENAIKDGE